MGTDLTQLPKITMADRLDVLLVGVDGYERCCQVFLQQAIYDLFPMISVDMRRNIFRGRNLGEFIGEREIASIRNGSFDDMFIGDYWFDGDVYYIIADFNYWKNQDLNGCPTPHQLGNHLVLVLSSHYFNGIPMNSAASIPGGYPGTDVFSKCSTSGEFYNIINESFRDVLLTRSSYLPSAVMKNTEMSYAWYETVLDVPNEIMVCGTNSFSRTPWLTANNFSDVRKIDSRQLSLFNLNPHIISINPPYNSSIFNYNGDIRPCEFYAGDIYLEGTLSNNYISLRSVFNNTNFCAIDRENVCTTYRSADSLNNILLCCAIG